jgi:macrolide-specific efflux system membrane fusion protein
MMIDYEKLVADEEKARAQLDSARDQQARREAEERLEELVRQRQKFDIDLQIFNLNMEQQELNYQRTLERVERAEMRSPIDGIVNFSQRIAVGDWVNSYQNLFTVVDPSILYLCFQPTSFSKFQVGVKAEVTIDGQLYHGTIVMSPAATNMEITDERFRNTVVVEIEDLPEEVEAGDTASLKFIFNERKNVIIIPKSGLRNYGTRDYVVVRHDGVNREVDVEKGMETATYVEIISGLDEGAEIILR